MRDTQFYDDVTRLVKNRAFAFDKAASGEWRDNTPHSQRTGAGGVLTTVRDLLAWDNNVYEPKVGTAALIAQVHETGVAQFGEAADVRVRPADRPVPRTANRRARRLARRLPRAPDALPRRAHLGGVPVQLRHERSRAARPPRRRSGAARSVSAAGAGVTRSRDRHRPSSASAPLVTLTAAQLAEYAGRYASDEADTTFVFDADGTGLRLKRERDVSPTALRALAPDRFGFRGMVIRFLRENGRITGLAVDAGRVVDIRFTRRSEPVRVRSGSSPDWNGRRVDARHMTASR